MIRYNNIKFTMTMIGQGKEEKKLSELGSGDCPDFGASPLAATRFYLKKEGRMQQKLSQKSNTWDDFKIIYFLSTFTVML